MRGLLEGQLAVVTGGGSGIGRAICLGYAKEGARVIVLDINEETMAHTEKLINGAGGKAWSFRLDVTDREACRRVAADIAGSVGQVSILVNNAGINRRNAFAAEPEAVLKDWQDIMAINVGGVFNVTHAFLGPLRATRGRIINIGSIQSFMHVRTPNSPAYTTSKHAVLGFSPGGGAGQAGGARQHDRSRPDRDAAQCPGAGQQPRACENLCRPHATRPRGKA